MVEWYGVLGFLGLSLCLILGWAFGVKLPRLRNLTYEELLEERERLKEAVVHWRYADGTYVPQHKRQGLFKELHKISHRIRLHPDNPANSSGGSDAD